MARPLSRGLSSRASSRPFSQGGKPKFATSFDKNDVWMELFLPRDPRNPNAERPKRFENMKPLVEMASDPDGYLRENYPWTYGTYAQARDYWYGET